MCVIHALRIESVSKSTGSSLSSTSNLLISGNHGADTQTATLVAQCLQTLAGRAIMSDSSRICRAGVLAKGAPLSNGKHASGPAEALSGRIGRLYTWRCRIYEPQAPGGPRTEVTGSHNVRFQRSEIRRRLFPGITLPVGPSRQGRGDEKTAERPSPLPLRDRDRVRRTSARRVEMLFIGTRIGINRPLPNYC